jgi:hypothetical protein
MWDQLDSCLPAGRRTNDQAMHMLFNLWAMKDISGNNFSITERCILENWDEVLGNIERIEVLLKE